MSREKSAVNDECLRAINKWYDDEGAEVPTVSLFGNYSAQKERSMWDCVPELPEEYEDPSTPENRRGWFFYNEPSRKYLPMHVRYLENMFIDVIQDEENPVRLLNVLEDVKLCERLPTRIKENLLLNIRNKLNR